MPLFCRRDLMSRQYAQSRPGTSAARRRSHLLGSAASTFAARSYSFLERSCQPEIMYK